METFAMYLLKSAIWLTGFALVYFLFLRNERFFRLKRYYLLSGILISLLFPLILVHYQVEMPAPAISNADIIPTENYIPTLVQQVKPDNQFDFRHILLLLYLSGVLYVSLRLIWRIRTLFSTISKAGFNKQGPAKLIRSSEYSFSFSFFNYVFINPSIDDTEAGEILNHELVHVHQKHWFDLLIVEFLRVVQWVNPIVWIYTGFIRLNHEYLADEAALQRTSDPAIYRAALLNQMFSSPVISLSNSFNYSLNKKRFEMMKKIITSPYRKMKVLFVLPVFAILLYAFAEPEYHYVSPADNTMTIYEVSGIQTQPVNDVILKQEVKPLLEPTLQSNEVKGIVVQEDGKPLERAAIVVKGTTIGTSADINGFFKLYNVPDEALLVASYVGYKSKVVKPDFTSEMTIKMERDTIVFEYISDPPPPPPPPPPSAGLVKNSSPLTLPLSIDTKGNNVINKDKYLKIRSNDRKTPLLLVDGVEKDIDVNNIPPNSIESITVLKNESEKGVYGEKGKNGVILVKTKKSVSLTNNHTFLVVEEMPEFPGDGKEAMAAWIALNLKYPAEAIDKKLEGIVRVRFVINSEGKVGEVVVLRSENPVLDEEAKRVISSMPDWKPGRQAGKAVDVYYMVPVEFKLQ